MKITKRLESSIERAACRRIKQLGGITRKMNGFGNRAWPDQLVLGPFNTCIFIEFKRPGAKLTPLQDYLHRKLKLMGHTVAVFSSVEEAVEFYKTKCAKCRVVS